MADQFLSQDEVDALLTGVNGDTAVEETNEPLEGPQAYDLGKSERIVRGRMPTLEIIHDRFSRGLRVGLFNFMRRNPEVSVGQVKVQKYSDFLRNISVPTNINLMAIKPLRGNGLLICEPQLIFSIIDSLFGGNGEFPTRIEGREFSPTENRIIERVVEVISLAYGKAWSSVYPLTLEYQRSEMQPQLASVATPSEVVVTASFAVELGESGGHVHLCIPYSVLEPIREVLYSSTNGEAGASDRRWVGMLTQQIKTAQVQLAVDLATTELTVRDLTSLKVGDFIALPLSRTVQAKVDNVPVFDCQYGTSNNHYSVRVDRIITLEEEHQQGKHNER